MEQQYYHLRSDKAQEFDVVNLIDRIQDRDEVEIQLDILNEYFFVLAMERTITIANDDGVRFTYYIGEEDDYCRGESTGMGEAVTQWRIDLVNKLKEEFDRLETYYQRVSFCNKHFGFEIGTYKPEGVEFSTMPKTAGEVHGYNGLVYRQWELPWIEAQAREKSGKDFYSCKNRFESRVVNTLHPDRKLQEAIDSVYNEYYLPGKVWKPGEDFHYLAAKTFRDREDGIKLFASFQDEGFVAAPPNILKFIEGQHAYMYYEYLINLQRNPDWLNEIKAKKADQKISNSKKVAPALFITKLARQTIFDGLCDSIDSSLHPILIKCLEGDKPSSPIVLNCRQVELAQLFYQNMSKINGGAPAVSRWLCEMFRLNKTGSIVRLSQSTLENYLKGKGFSEKRVSKLKKN